jgi:hypothetical protein
VLVAKNAQNLGFVIRQKQHINNLFLASAPSHMRFQNFWFLATLSGSSDAFSPAWGEIIGLPDAGGVFRCNFVEGWVCPNFSEKSCPSCLSCLKNLNPDFLTGLPR